LWEKRPQPPCREAAGALPRARKPRLACRQAIAQKDEGLMRDFAGQRQKEAAGRVNLPVSACLALASALAVGRG